jgi:hypothetical protein
LKVRSLAPVAARAQYRVTQNLSSPSGLGAFYFNFHLTDGDQTGDGDSRADIFNLALTGGSLGAVLPPTTGDAQGNLNTTLTLRDSDAAVSGLADFAQAFTITGTVGSVILRRPTYADILSHLSPLSAKPIAGKGLDA